MFAYKWISIFNPIIIIVYKDLSLFYPRQYKDVFINMVEFVTLSNKFLVTPKAGPKVKSEIGLLNIWVRLGNSAEGGQIHIKLCFKLGYT